MLKLLALLSLSGCTLSQVNKAALVTSTATLACDWAQTRGAAADWGGRMEANPVLGPQPSQTKVDFYFVGILAANAVAWVLLPKQARAAVSGVVTGVQTKTIIGNFETASYCGF